MELLWKEETLDTLAARASLEIALEGEIPLPEGRACSSVLSARTSVESRSCVCSAQSVQLEGVLLLTLLCEDGDELYAFVSRAPFSHTYTECGAEDARTAFCVSESNLKVENGALRFSATLSCDLLLSQSVTLKTLRDITGLEAGQLQRREGSFTLTRRRACETQSIQLREEAAVSGAAEVLAASGTVIFQRTQEESIEPVLFLSALCRSGEGRLRQIVQQLPLHLEEEYPEIESCSLTDLSVRSVGEEFGILAVEGTLKMRPAQIESHVSSFPLDAFAPAFPFVCVHTEYTALRDLGTRAWRYHFDAALPLPEGLPEASECIYACAQAIVTAAATENDRLYIEGVLDTRAVYRSAGGKRCCFSRELPFSADFAAPQCDLIQLEAEAFVLCDGGGSALQARCTLCFQASFAQSVPLRVVTGIHECEKEKPASGLVLLFAGAGENMFEIAKRYNVTLESLYELQGELHEPLEEGQKLLLLV